VPFEQVGPGTYYVLAGLLLGKPIGILLFSTVARLAGGSLPPGLRTGDLLVVGVVASIGFTVSLFFATAAFPGGAALAETKMGALLSFVAARLALVVSRIVQWRGFHSRLETHRGDSTGKVVNMSEGR
jgi:Na+:H+ antiporter, NhaA family